MTGNKKVSCKVCYREMRSDNVTRHMKQHSKRDESNPLTNISLTNNVYKSTASTQRSEGVLIVDPSNIEILNLLFFFKLNNFGIGQGGL